MIQLGQGHGALAGGIRGVTVLMANPDVRVRRDRHEVVIRTAPDELAAGHETGVSIDMTQDDAGPLRVVAQRGITTGDELYYGVLPSNEVLLSDNFRAILSRIPAAHRRRSDAGLADHLLFRTTPGGTYVAGVYRLGHGSRLTIDIRRGSLELDQYDSLRPGAGGSDAVGSVIDALDSAIRMTPHLDHACNMLSGGIDSTLIQTFLPRGAPSVSAGIDSPEFANEVAYARRASQLTGTAHSVVAVRESDYLHLLEECIETLGLPPHHLQTVLLDAIFRGVQPAFITGQLADALFGLEVSVAAWRANAFKWLLRAPGFSALAERLAPVRQRYRRYVGVLEDLNRDAADPAGFAMQFAVYSDMKHAASILGAEVIADRLMNRLGYVLARVEGLTQRNGMADHLRLGHWIDFYCDDTVSIWRQLAHARGKALHAPFTSPEVAMTALSVPASRLYVSRGAVKHVLKEALRRRLPSYPVGQPKGGSGLPFARLYTQGSLSTGWDSYRMPGGVPSELAESLRREPSWVSWNLLTYAIWEARVLSRADLTAPPGATVLSWERQPTMPQVT